MSNIDPLEIGKTHLRRLMNEFDVDLDKAYDMTIKGFVYKDGDIERPVPATTDKNTIAVFQWAYSELMNEV